MITKLTPFLLASDLTTDEDIRKARLVMKLNGSPVLDGFFRKFLTDPDGDDRNVVNLYAIADEHERGTMDALMIALCGCSFGELVRETIKKI